MTDNEKGKRAWALVLSERSSNSVSVVRVSDQLLKCFKALDWFSDTHLSDFFSFLQFMVQGFPTQFLIGRSSHKILKKCFTLKKIYVYYVYSSFINQLNLKVTNSSTKTTKNLIDNKGVEYLNGEQTWAVIFAWCFPHVWETHRGCSLEL